GRPRHLLHDAPLQRLPGRPRPDPRPRAARSRGARRPARRRLADAGEEVGREGLARRERRLGLVRAVAVVAAFVCGALLVPRAGASSFAAPKPSIVAKPIPFPQERKLEMQAYARRHYGIDTWQLRSPRVIVEHVTVSSTFGSAFATFAADRPDAELHELPGTCAH